MKCYKNLVPLDESSQRTQYGVVSLIFSLIITLATSGIIFAYSDFNLDTRLTQGHIRQHEVYSNQSVLLPNKQVRFLPDFQYIFKLDYIYKDFSEKEHRGSFNVVDSRLWNSIQDGSAITIVYKSNNPDVSHVYGANDPSRLSWAFLISGGIGLVISLFVIVSGMLYTKRCRKIRLSGERVAGEGIKIVADTFRASDGQVYPYHYLTYRYELGESECYGSIEVGNDQTALWEKKLSEDPKFEILVSPRFPKDHIIRLPRLKKID